MASLSRPSASLMLGRALRARCPNCGSRGLFRSWFKVHERCPRCGILLERGESHDYWIGGMMLNIALAEGLAVLVVGLAIYATYPDIAWNAIWFGAIALMVIAPFLMYPVSRIVWLAFDMIFRPGHEAHRR